MYFFRSYVSATFGSQTKSSIFYGNNSNIRDHRHAQCTTSERRDGSTKKTLDDLKQKKAEALKDSGTSVNDIKQINKEIRKAEDHVNAYRSRVSDTINTLQNLSTASIGEIERYRVCSSSR